jgi:hypothetical protein
MRRIGVLTPYPENDPDGQARNAAFPEALQESPALRQKFSATPK